MGGREAIRGFAVQTLICLLDAVEGDMDWTAVSIEPDTANDKVDISWQYVGRTKAVQVKSSQNPIGRTDVAAWCAELEKSSCADELELRLAGPLTSNALTADCGRVVVPPSSTLVLADLSDQAVTRLDRYLVRSGIDTVPVAVRTSLVNICAARLLSGSATGEWLKRQEFDGWLLQWIAAAYPEAISARLASNCEVLWSSARIGSPPLGSRAFELTLPLTFYNSGRSAAVVEWVILLTRSDDRRMIYGSHWSSGPSSKVPFMEFAVGAGQVVEREIVFRPFRKTGFEIDAWPLGLHELELLVKFSAEVSPRPVKTTSIVVTGEHMTLLNGSGFIDIRLSSMDGYMNGV